MTDPNSQFLSILTDVGIAKQTAADALGIPWKLAEMAVGDANDTEPLPTPGQTALINERYRASLNALIQDPANPGTFIAELVVPLDVGGWWVRELGLYDEDGDLVAVASCPPSYKPLPSQGSVRSLRVRMRFVISNDGQIELIVSDDIVYASTEYCDSRIREELAKLDGKQSVKVATTENISLSGLLRVDGIELVADDRVLVKHQADATQNGLYTAAADAWTRAQDADLSIEVTASLYVLVESGIQFADSLWQLVTDGPITLGTTPLSFEMLAGRTGVVPGTYPSVTVDAYGRVLSGAAIPALDTLSRVLTLTGTTVLTEQQVGLVLLDATQAELAITLPAAAASLTGAQLMLRRTDITTNNVTLLASGADTLMLDTSVTGTGQASTELLFAGDYLQLRCDGAGHWHCVAQAPLPPSLESGLLVFSAPGAQTWTVPAVLRAGRRKAKVTVVGAGGSGSSSANASEGGCGGAAGGYAIKVIDLSAVATVSITIGTGGAGVNASVGVAGGASSFGEYCSATGGAGGPQRWDIGSARGGFDSARGGIGTGGDLNGSGGEGQLSGTYRDAVSGLIHPTVNGLGGSSCLSGAVGYHLSGEPAVYGAGTGGTGSAGTSSKAGDGLVKIEW